MIEKGEEDGEVGEEGEGKEEVGFFISCYCCCLYDKERSNSLQLLFKEIFCCLTNDDVLLF